MTSYHDVIVVGVGSMGAATCFHLAKRGVKVLGIDSQPVPNTNSSYNGNTRVIRLTYQEHPDYVPLLKEAYRLWGEIEQETGTKLLHKTGVLYMGFPDGKAISGVKLASETHQLPYSTLTHTELAEQFPQFNLPDGMVGALEPEGGYLLSERSVKAYACAAQSNGATMITSEPVLDWSHDAFGVTVRTASGSHTASQLIFSVGAWSGHLLRLPKVELTVTRQILGWVTPPDTSPFQRGEFPVWNIDPNGDDDLTGIYYGFPMSNDPDEEKGLKLAWHHPGKPMPPEAIKDKVLPTDEDEIKLPLRRYLPTALGPIETIKVCKYTNSKDGHFVIDRHPESDRVHFACGFSGHGFKFSSVMGSALSDLALSGETRYPINFLRLARFSN